MPAGTAYVYFTYGMYYCFNISSQEPGAAVLLRALEPLEGIEIMKQIRFPTENTRFKPKMLCNGPSKLCISMYIDKNKCNQLDLCNNDKLWLEDDDFDESLSVVTSSRIGLNSKTAQEWMDAPLRFYVYKNDCVSKVDRKAEEIFTQQNI